MSRHPAKHAMKSLTYCHATNIKSASEAIEPLSRHPAKHATKSLTCCQVTNTKSASEAIEQTAS
ncbi:hypothetical protein M404DRAFT_826740 [Pisolithus tinctorius Marx 270]|uniref:Uncharacterized protein n=1 Tax=Pisolithus tinctorius Marx 270 TaxID=870435 RepID=A0A0C3JN08_PISTI|nr:hypothetical protein M404DRAFT_826740 [Pisolithus tinctorius Marx 270]